MCLQNNLKSLQRVSKISLLESEVTDRRKMEAKFFSPLVDYDEINASNYLRQGQVNSRLLEKINRQIKQFDDTLTKYIRCRACEGDKTIYSGLSGVGLAYYMLFKRTGNKECFKQAFLASDCSVKHLKNPKFTFLHGAPGTLALAATLEAIRGQTRAADVLVEKLVKIGDRIPNEAPSNLSHGRAGYLFALLFIDHEIGPVIPEFVIRKHVEIILKNGFVEARLMNSPTPLEFKWNEQNLLGAASGLAGILYVLLVARDFELHELIRPTLDTLCQICKDNDFPKDPQGNNEDEVLALNQWCHGPPGFTCLFILASEIFRSDKYLILAKEVGEKVWKKGPPKKGYSLCHGVSGNAYTFLALYRKTKEEKYLYRACAFADWCLRYPYNEGMKPDHPYSLFEGIAGIMCFLQDIKLPSSEEFPAFEFHRIAK